MDTSHIAKISYWTSLNWPVLHSTKRDCKYANIDPYCKSFYCTCVFVERSQNNTAIDWPCIKFDTCHSEQNWLHGCRIFTRVMIYEFDSSRLTFWHVTYCEHWFFGTSHNESTSLDTSHEMFLFLCSPWHVSNCYNVVEHVTLCKRVILSLFVLWTCPYWHLSYCTPFCCEHVHRTQPIL